MKIKTTHQLINSASSVPAHYVDLLQVSNDTQADIYKRDFNVIKKSNLHEVDKALLLVMLDFGLRVSDICNCGSWFLISENIARYIQKKTGVAMTFTLTLDTAILRDKIKNKSLKNFEKSRFFYYRQLKRLGVGKVFFKNKNKSITHYYRHRLAEEVITKSNDMKITANILGHKSTKSTEHYVNRKQEVMMTKEGVLSKPKGTIANINITKTGVIRIKK